MMFDSDPFLRFIEPSMAKKKKIKSGRAAKPVSRTQVKRAKEKQKTDFIRSLDLDGKVRHFYLQGYGANAGEKNPYQSTAYLAFHAWEAGHFDRYGY